MPKTMDSFQNDTRLPIFQQANIAVNVILTLLVFLIIVINIWVIVLTFAGNCMEKLNIAVYILSLAVADTTVGITTVPFIIDMWFPGVAITEQFMTCLTIEIVMSICVAVSVCTLTWICGTQYVSVKYPMVYKTNINKNFAICSSVGIWVCSAVIMVPLYLMLAEDTTESHTLCHASSVLKNNYFAFNAFTVVVYCMLLAAMAFLNWKTLQEMRERSRRVSSRKSKVHYSLKSNQKRSIEIPELTQKKDVALVTEDVSMVDSNQSSGKVIPLSENKLDTCSPEEDEGMPSRFESKERTQTTDEDRVSLKNRFSLMLAHRRLSRYASTDSTTQKHGVPYKTILFLVLAFVVCLAPHFVFSVYELLFEEHTMNLPNIEVIRIVLLIGILSNSIINPLTYAFRMPVYKRYMKNQVLNKLNCYKCK